MMEIGDDKRNHSQNDVKQKIWCLDHFLECFSGMDWISKVGDVARLKSLFINLSGKVWPDCEVSPQAHAKLNHYFMILSDDSKSKGKCDAAFYGAVAQLELILTRMERLLSK